MPILYTLPAAPISVIYCNTYQARLIEIVRFCLIFSRCVRARVVEKNKTGVCQYASGSRYEGLWLDGLRHGEGVLISPTGDAQAGVWHRDESITLPAAAAAAAHEETSGAAPEGLGSLARQEEAAA